MNQHFIPKFIIENFVDDAAKGNRGVWVCRRSTGKWSKRPTRKTAALEDFYTFVEDNGDRDDTLEEFMERIETQVAPIIRNGIEKARKLSPPQPYDVFVCFCALLICRNPATFERVKASIARHFMNVLKSDFADQVSFQRFRAEFRERTGRDFPNFPNPASVLANFDITTTRAAGIGFSIMMLKPLNEQLGRYHVRFLRAPESRAFITSDAPYAVQAHFGSIKELLVPLSPKTCAAFYPDTTVQYDYLDIDESDVDYVNGAILSVAREFLVAHSPRAIDGIMLSHWIGRGAA